MRGDMTDGAIPRPLVRRRRVRVGAHGPPLGIDELVDSQERLLETEIVLPSTRQHVALMQLLHQAYPRVRAVAGKAEVSTRDYKTPC